MTVLTGIDGVPANDLVLAASGDEAAFARLVTANHPTLIRVAFLVCGDLDLAEEAVAAAWPLAWRNLRSVRDPERLRPWLVTIAANEARRLGRSRRRRRLHEVPVEAAIHVTTSDPAARPMDLDLVAALDTLTPDDRTLLALRYVAGFDASEIGHATGRTASGTRVRLFRLLDRLRTELDR